MNFKFWLKSNGSLKLFCLTLIFNILLTRISGPIPAGPNEDRQTSLHTCQALGADLPLWTTILESNIQRGGSVVISNSNELDLICLSVLQFVQALGQHVSIFHRSVGSSIFS